MNIFLTGGTGFLGSHFINAAYSRGYNVTALKSSKSQAHIPTSKSANWVEGSLTCFEFGDLIYCDTFVHLAAAGVTANGDSFGSCFETNVYESVRIWERAIKHGISNFLICGSCFEYGKSANSFDFIPADAPLYPTTAYAASKAAATAAAIGLCQHYRVNLIIVRPFHLYGEGESTTRFVPALTRAARAGQNYSMTGGEQIRDFTPVSFAAEKLVDICSAQHDSVATCSVTIQNLGTGKPTKLLDFANNLWKEFSATGQLLHGSIPYRRDEIMRYVPDLTPVKV